MLANFTAQVNGELQVGGVTETVEVTAETPLIDVQSSAVARAVTKEMIREIPSGGTMYQLAATMVGVTMSGGAAVVDVGGSTGSPVQAQLSAHGGAAGDEVQMIDGLKVGNMMSNSGRTNQTLSPLLFEQIDVQISGHGGDSPTIGVQSNLIPRTGGNSFHGTALANGSSGGLQSNNLTSRLKAFGLTDTTRLKNMYDINGGFGGPVVYAGDALNSYNDGPLAPGKPGLGPFYELESSSPALKLQPGEHATHVHRTFHFQGTEAALDPIARAVLNVGLADLAATFKQ